MTLKNRDVFLFLIAMAGLQSCSKTTTNSNQANTGCIERIFLHPSTFPINAPPILLVDPITQAQIDTIHTLFTNNNLPFNQYQFVGYVSYQYSNDTIQTQVDANPFLNGLPIYGGGEVFIFFNGSYSASSSYLNLSPEIPTNNDTTGNQSLPNLRSAFLKYVPEATITGPMINAKPIAPLPSAYLDTCLSATLG